MRHVSFCVRPQGLDPRSASEQSLALSTRSSLSAPTGPPSTSIVQKWRTSQKQGLVERVTVSRLQHSPAAAERDRPVSKELAPLRRPYGGPTEALRHRRTGDGVFRRGIDAWGRSPNDASSAGRTSGRDIDEWRGEIQRVGEGVYSPAKSVALPLGLTLVI